ncbi:hypothetical protein EDC96DRAFT_544831 [Choanephora cucurbitarum]|nr:hypothetical protein EDC96DRAFT_544831 [Choanephora cucurbitarum]
MHSKSKSRISFISSIQSFWFSSHLLSATGSSTNAIQTVTFRYDQLAVFSDQKSDFLIAKVKKPQAKITRLVGDEAKLANLLKIMLNRLILQRIPSPVVCGIINDGTFTKTFKTIIKSSGNYDFVQLACFQSTRCIDDLARLPNAMNYMNQMKDIVLYMQEIIRMTMLGEPFPDPLCLGFPVPLEWLRSSFKYPVAEKAKVAFSIFHLPFLFTVNKYIYPLPSLQN